MFRFVRWIFLLAVIAALAGFALTYRLGGKSSADRACRLLGSPICVRTAARWATVARGWETLLAARLDHPQSGAEPAGRTEASIPRRAPHAPPSEDRAAGRRAGARGAEARPLDQHTPEERKALDRLLATRGSH